MKQDLPYTRSLLLISGILVAVAAVVVAMVLHAG